MSGRKLGRCNPENKGKADEEIIRNKDASVQPGQGFGFGLGRGRGLGHGRGLGQGLGRRFRGNA
jgi:hypothetical protein